MKSPAKQEHHHYSPRYLKALEKAAKIKSGQLAKKIGLSPAEQDDIYQELVIKALEAAPKFNAALGCEGAFIGQVLKNRGFELMDKTIKERMQTVSLDSSTGEGDDSECHSVFAIADLLDEDTDLFSQFNANHDFLVALVAMTQEQRHLLHLLMEHASMANACAASQMSSSSFYRSVEQLKLHLSMFGFDSLNELSGKNSECNRKRKHEEEKGN